MQMVVQSDQHRVILNLPSMAPARVSKKLEILGETQTLCIHNCILNIEEQKSETDQESLNVVKRCSTDFRTPWNPGRPPPQMFKVYIVSRWIWADLRAIRLRAVIVSVDAGASLGGLPATHWMSGRRNVVMAVRSRSPDFPRHCPSRKLSLWFSSL